MKNIIILICSIGSAIRIGNVCVLLLCVVKLPFLSNNLRGKCIVSLLKFGGVAFVKLGQSLAVRADIVGDDIAHHLSQLQDKMPAFSYKLVRKSIRTAFGREIEDVFATFDNTPIAAASIAQVHFAQTMATEAVPSEDVAVKILRPNIERIFLQDIRAFYFYAKMLEVLMPSSRRLRPRQVVTEMKQWVTEELNLSHEALNAVQLRQNFIDSDIFSVPKIYMNLTTRSVLTTERVYGLRIDDRQGLIDAGLNPTDILKNSATVFFLQVFRDGFFHADMHPGNMFVTADGILSPVDFGIMGRLSKDTRIYVADVLYYIVLQEYEKTAQVHFNAGYVPSTYSLSAFTKAIADIDKRLREQGDPRNMSMGSLLADLFKTTKRFNMKTRPELLLLQKTIVVAEGVGRTIAPNENMWVLIRPVMESWMKVNRGIGARVEHMINAVIDKYKK